MSGSAIPSGKKIIVGLFTFFLGVASMALSIYELRATNPEPPAGWTIPLLFVGTALTIGGILYSASQHIKKNI